ncbi:MAG: acyl-CoA dehydrogenase, partial [Candidatus Dadabacteria bacterium]
MDFTPTEDQQAVGRLAREILEKEVTAERLRAAERSQDWYDQALWRTLAEAGLVGLAAPEHCGGMGLGVLEA